MEKMIWSKPEMNEFAFAANEYVASCGAEKKYLFNCNAGGGQSGYVWIEDNNKDELQSDMWGDQPYGGYSPEDKYDHYLGTYHACGWKHEASSTDNFYNGYYIADDKWNNGNFNALDVLKVIIWRGYFGFNIHCTTELNMESWETAKS